jgi:hypothetical protein
MYSFKATKIINTECLLFCLSVLNSFNSIVHLIYLLHINNYVSISNFLLCVRECVCVCLLFFTYLLYENFNRWKIIHTTGFNKKKIQYSNSIFDCVFEIGCLILLAFSSNIFFIVCFYDSNLVIISHRHQIYV